MTLKTLKTASRKMLWASLKALMRLRDNGPVRSPFGICTNMSILMDGHEGAYMVQGLLAECFETWPMFSGDTQAPVPDVVNPLGLRIRKAASDIYWRTGVSKWPHALMVKAGHDRLYFGEETCYAHDRMALLNHCIHEIQCELAERLGTHVQQQV